MSKDNDGLCAIAEALVYGAMTHPMVFFRGFRAVGVHRLRLAAGVLVGDGRDRGPWSPS
jgi:hypothetical protein